jgi:hypothetical protein
LEETDAIITIEGREADFTQYKTYYLPDRVIDLCLQPESGTPTSEAIGGAAGGASIDPGNCFVTDHSSDEAVLASLAANMEDLGYTRVSEGERDEADLALLAGIVSRSSWSLSLDYCYPNNFYSGCVDQSNNPEVIVPTDSFVFQLIDVEASSGTELVSVWTGAVHQLQKISAELGTSLGGGPTSTKSQIWTSSIDQAFEQSPYLAEGGE